MNPVRPFDSLSGALRLKIIMENIVVIDIEEV